MTCPTSTTRRMKVGSSGSDRRASPAPSRFPPPRPSRRIADRIPGFLTRRVHDLERSRHLLHDHPVRYTGERSQRIGWLVRAHDGTAACRKWFRCEGMSDRENTMSRAGSSVYCRGARRHLQGVICTVLTASAGRVNTRRPRRPSPLGASDAAALAGPPSDGGRGQTHGTARTRGVSGPGWSVSDLPGGWDAHRMR